MTKSVAFNVDKSRSIISALIHGGKVRAIDVAWLRREVFADGEVSRDAADELFAVERSNIEKCPEWTEFLAEMITEHVVWQSRPTGVVNEPQAQWLIARADECRSIGAMAAMVNVLVEAHQVPQWLAAALFWRYRAVSRTAPASRCTCASGLGHLHLRIKLTLPRLRLWRALLPKIAFVRFPTVLNWS